MCVASVRHWYEVSSDCIVSIISLRTVKASNHQLRHEKTCFYVCEKGHR